MMQALQHLGDPLSFLIVIAIGLAASFVVGRIERRALRHSAAPVLAFLLPLFVQIGLIVSVSQYECNHPKSGLVPAGGGSRLALDGIGRYQLCLNSEGETGIITGPGLDVPLNGITAISISDHFVYAAFNPSTISDSAGYAMLDPDGGAPTFHTSRRALLQAMPAGEEDLHFLTPLELFAERCWSFAEILRLYEVFLFPVIVIAAAVRRYARGLREHVEDMLIIRIPDGMPPITSVQFDDGRAIVGRRGAGSACNEQR